MLSAGVVLLALVFILVASAAPAPHASSQPIVAVCNRDVEGAVVLSGDSNYASTALDCYSQCKNTTGCNLWVWCPNAAGCLDGGNTYTLNPARYRQCWLKYGDPSATHSFPLIKNSPSQQASWLSGTTSTVKADVPPLDATYAGCNCESDYTAMYNGRTVHFKGVCANPSGGYSAECYYNAEHGGCTSYTPSQTKGTDSCPSTLPCLVLVNADVDGEVILQTYTSAPEECCGQCAARQGCNVWTWCSDANGCSGELPRYKQCWLKSTPDPTAPVFKTGDVSGWLSGVRQAYVAS